MKTALTLNSDYDHVKLSVVVIAPEGRPDAVLQIAHGMCGNKERFLPFMEYMSGHGTILDICMREATLHWSRI